MKASLADDDEVSTMEVSTTQAVLKAPRQTDINIGVILMFAGAVVAALLAGRGLGREGGALILAISFLSLLFLSRPIMKVIYKLLSWDEPPAHSFSVKQRRMIFGSMLMFASTIFVTIGSLLMFGRMKTDEFLFGLIAAFVLLLIFSKHLMRALHYLVAGNEDVAVFSRTNVARDPIATDSSPALSAGQDVPVSLFTSQRVTTAEILAPASVTEQTTNLLENK